MAGMNEFNPLTDPSIQGLPEQQRRQAEGTIRSAKESSGPQETLEKSNYDFKDLRFPFDIGDGNANPRYMHWIKFTPCVQEKSEYNVQKEKKGSKEVYSVADSTNRYTTANQFEQFGIGDAVGLTAGFATLGAAEGFASGLSSAESVGELVSKTGVGAIKGGAIGAFAGTVVNSINLSRKTRRAAASIALYMPDTVNQTIVNDYDQVSLTQALGSAGLLAQAGGSVIEGAMNAAKSDKLNFGQTPGSAGLAEAAGFLGEKSGAFGQGITDVLLFSAGYAQNPQVELLFKSIQNREFLFDFKFVPRNSAEAKKIIEIIKTFRFFAAPEIPATSRGRYFVPPSEFDIQFMFGKNANPNLPKISTCVLQGIDVNYGSAGQWTAFKDGMPVEIAMQLRFKEVEIMHKKLIEDGF